MKLAMKRVELIIDYEQNTMSTLFIMKLIVSPVQCREPAPQHLAVAIERESKRRDLLLELRVSFWPDALVSAQSFVS